MINIRTEMKLKLLLSFFIMSFTFCTSNFQLYGAFKDAGWGTRPAGMGGAFTAIADDSTGPLWNPSGIAQMSYSEASFMYSNYYTGLDLKAADESVTLGFNYLSFVTPKLGFGSIGLSWANFSTSNLYNEDTYTLTYAKKLNDWITLTPEVFAGFNLKYLNHAYTLDKYAKLDPVFVNGTSKDAVAVDLGVLIKPYDKISIGLAGKNLNQPDVGLKDKDIVPMEILVGAAYRWTPITPLFDVKIRDGNTRFSLGAESWLFEENLGIRAGFNTTEATVGLSFAGIRSDVLGLNLDYSFILPLKIQESSGSHRISLGIWWY